MQCGRMPFAVLKRCIIGQRFRNQHRSETMIFYRCERNQGQLPAKKNPLDLGTLLGGWNPAELLEQLDKDQILILVLLVMLYKEGGDKKLMMALAYLLT